MNARKTSDAQTPESLLNDLRALVTEAEEMLAGGLSAGATEAVAGLRDRFEAARERLSALYEGTRKNVAAGAKYTDETIRANPYQSLAIAAGAGLLVGVLLGRRGR